MSSSNSRLSSARIGALIVVVLGAVASAGACLQGGNEGDRCNPDLSHNECDNGLTCITPGTCVEAYCCPADPTASTSAYCRGLPPACPAADAAPSGEEAGSDAGGDAANAADSPADG